jgi:hypothetical protein
MTIDTITMDPAAAKQAYREYQAAVRGDRAGERARWRAEDLALMTAYKQLAKGRAVLDVGAAMRSAGLREDGYPRLAICAAHLSRCYCHMGYSGEVTFSGSWTQRWRERSPKAERVELPVATFATPASKRGETVSTLVPIIPPALRPKFKLEGFHMLWEVESWTLEPPRDPLLLRHLGGQLYAVLAVWDLTPLERAVLGGRA